jgi:flagellar motility protein MotE (MotC chaperone)
MAVFVFQRTSDLQNRLSSVNSLIEKHKEEIEKQRWFMDNTGDEGNAERTCQQLEKQSAEYLTDIKNFQEELSGLEQKSDGKQQMDMWEGMVQLLRKKIDVHMKK